MSMNVSSEMSSTKEIAVSEGAKRQIGVQASEVKARCADPKGTNFLDFLAGPSEK